jgi:hypothetical protein
MRGEEELKPVKEGSVSQIRTKQREPSEPKEWNFLSPTGPVEYLTKKKI